jgi:hypothetical protein
MGEPGVEAECRDHFIWPSRGQVSYKFLVLYPCRHGGHPVRKVRHSLNRYSTFREVTANNLEGMQTSFVILLSVGWQCASTRNLTEAGMVDIL